MWPMVASEFIKARLPLELKLRVKACSERQLLTESAWLKCLVLRELEITEEMPENFHRHQLKGRSRRNGRIYVRLRHDDKLLLAARASARGMRAATYVSALTRSHLRALAPLPKDELLALKRSIGELAAIGRNLNQIVRAANEGARFPGISSGNEGVNQNPVAANC